MLIAFCVGVSFAVVSMVMKRVVQRSSPADRFGKTGVVATTALNDILVLGYPPEGLVVVVHVFRQSGNPERSIACGSREEALFEVQKLFNRMQEPNVRIWENRSLTCDIRRRFGSFRGQSEGKKVWGCRLEFAKAG